MVRTLLLALAGTLGNGCVAPPSVSLVARVRLQSRDDGRSRSEHQWLLQTALRTRRAPPQTAAALRRSEPTPRARVRVRVSACARPALCAWQRSETARAMSAWRASLRGGRR